MKIKVRGQKSVVAALAMLFAGFLVPEVQAADANTVLLFSFLRDNGQDGPYLATSSDGLKWTELKPLTATNDFETFNPTKLFCDGGFNVIDTALLGADGKFHLILKDETTNPEKKNLRMAVSDHPEGPFGPAGPPFTGDWVEGPSAIQIGEKFYVFFDHYAKPQYYGAVQSGDLTHWQEISDRVSFPKGARHGTVLRVLEIVVQRIQTKTSEP